VNNGWRIKKEFLGVIEKTEEATIRKVQKWGRKKRRRDEKKFYEKVEKKLGEKSF